MNQSLQFAQKALIIKDNKILVIKNSSNAKYKPNMVHLPGGRMNFGEDLEEHIIREVWEETNVKIKPSMPLALFSWIVKNNSTDRNDLIDIDLQVVAVFRECFYVSGKPNLLNKNDDETIDKVYWESIDNLMNNSNFDPKAKVALENWLAFYSKASKS